MTRKSGDLLLKTLESRFKSLRQRAGGLPTASRQELEPALKELSQAIAALRAARADGPTPAADPAAPPDRCATILQNIFNAIPDLLTVIDRDFNIVMSNWHGLDFVPEEARRGQPHCYRLYHRRDRPCEDCHVLQVFATGQPQKLEKINPIDERIREFSLFPILDASGHITLVAEHVRDVTEQRRAEQALKESEERFRAIFETAQDSIFIKDLTLRYSQVNPAMERLFNRPAADLIGRTDEELFGKGAGAHIRTVDQRVLNGEMVKETHAKPVQGVPTTFHVIKVPLYDATGMVIVGLCGIARDITDLKQAEEALRESEARFRMLFEYAPDAHFLMDLQGNFLDVNRGTEELTGYGREELIGKNYQALPLFEERQNSMVAALLDQAVNDKILGPIELNLKRKDGGNVIIEAKGLPLHRNGESLLLGIARDITDYKQAEEALRKSEQRFRDITENAAEWVWEVDAQGKYLYSSPVVKQLLGYKPEEVLGKHFYDLFLPDQREKLKNAALAVFAAKQPFQDFHNPNLHKNGRIVWLSTSGVPLLDKQGNLLGYRGSDIDITERREAEALSRNLIKNSPVGIYLIQNGRFQLVNQWFFTISGYGEDEFVNLKPLNLVHPEDREATRENALKMLKGLSSVPYEYRSVTKGGETKWIMETVTSIQYKGKRAVLGYFMDITQRKALERQLLQAQKMEAVGRLAGGVAHDFNNLLMAITGYGELMRAKVHKGDPLYDHLENILKAGDRATALTQQLLTFSRRQIVHPQVLDLNRVVLDLEPMLRRLIGEDLDLEVLTAKEPGVVKADPGHLGQIIMNLVVNARDAMPRGGRLTLKTAPVDFKESHHTRFGLAPPGPYVMLEVRDTGVGMDEATQAHAFEPFFTTKEPGKGTGLGLSTVYGIVKQSGGHLDLDSEPGAGSTCTIYLPRLTAIAEPPKAKIPITASFKGEETILLVEDEDVLRGLLARFLRLYGYKVLEARHAGEALLACEQHQGPIHVLVTDVVMPQMSGRELADRLTPLRPDMKVLFMSGYTEDALVQHGVTDHSVPFLQKPFKPIELARRLYAVLHPPVGQ